MTAHEQDLNELVAVLNGRLERAHVESTRQAGRMGDLHRDLEQSREDVQAILERLATAEADRDRARDAAVALEQETARLTAAMRYAIHLSESVSAARAEGYLYAALEGGEG